MSIVLLHLSYCMLYYCTTLYCLSVQHSHSRGNGRVSRLSQGNGGNYYNCASRVCGALFGSFLFAEVRSGRMSSYDPRGWGHSPKELVALSPPSNMAGIDQPDCDAGELTFPWFFCRDCWHHVRVTLEWNGCSLIFMSAFRFILLRWHRPGCPPPSSVWNIMLLFCEH